VNTITWTQYLTLVVGWCVMAYGALFTIIYWPVIAATWNNLRDACLSVMEGRSPFSSWEGE